MRVSLFVTCFDDALFPGTARAAVTLLERLGHVVRVAPEQTCCGQMHWTTGYHREAADLARRFAAVFPPRAADAIVTPSASCAAMVRRDYAKLGVQAPPVHELTEFLVDVLEVEDVGAYFPYRVAYQPTCHSERSLGAGDRPERLLRAVRGLELVPLGEAGVCCGFGGAFAIKNADVSVALVADKVRHVTQSGAEVVCAADNSCLAHIGGALSRLRGGVRAVHLAEILAATGEAAGSGPG